MKKKLSDSDKVVAALDALDRSVSSLARFRDRYDGYIDEAAMRGDDARAKQLIKQKIRVRKLGEQLCTLKSNIELGAFTSQAISELGKLPGAISGCKGLLAETPDFSRLGRSISSIFSDINKSESEIAKLNDLLDPQPVPTITSRLDGGVPADELTDDFKAEYEAMVMRVGDKAFPESVAKSDSTHVTPTGEIDYAGIMSEENKKK